MNTNSILQTWQGEPKNVANMIVDKYGEPDEVTKSMLVWHNNGPWQKTVVYNRPYKHVFPMPHEDVVEQTVKYRVPEDKFDELAKFDGSVWAKKTEGTISAKCHDEPANFLAINLANDIVMGKKSVEEARKEYAESVVNFRKKYEGTLHGRLAV